MNQSIRNRLSERLKKAMREHPQVNTQLALQKKSGVAQATIGRILRGEVNAGIETLADIARALDLEPTYFISVEVGGAQRLEISEPVTAYGPRILNVPIISWEKAALWGLDEYPAGAVSDSVNTIAPLSSNSFALRATKESITEASGITPPEGAVVLVDADASPMHGNIVIAHYAGNQKAIIKRFVVDGPNQYLEASTPSYKPLPVSHGCRIVGVAKKIEMDL